MKLVLYSGGQQRSNHKLHREVVRLARSGKDPRRKLKLTYFPFCSEDSELFFKRIMRRFRAHGVEQFFCLNADAKPTSAEIEEALSSDIIYLAGGNTFYFLKHLRNSKLLSKLKTFAKRGGVIAGLSAGALIMSPTVASAADPKLDPDENEVGLKNFRGLGLFQFEISPHVRGTRKQIKAHLAYSKKSRYKIYAVSDGSGMVIEGKKIRLIGRAITFYRGKILGPNVA